MRECARERLTLSASFQVGAELGLVLFLAKVPHLGSEFIYSVFIGRDTLNVLTITPAVVSSVVRS